MYYLGRSHSDAGEWEKSRRSFIEGAERNHQACMYWAGKMMIRGKGGSVDLERGRELIKRAANGGNIFAQRDLLLLEMKTSTSLSRKVVLAFQLVWTGLKNLPRYLKNPNTNEFG